MDTLHDGSSRRRGFTLKAGGRERGGQVGLASPSRVQAVAANEAGHAEGCAEVADEGRSEAASEATEREVMSEKKRPQGVYPRPIVRGGRTETVYDAVHEAPRVDGRRKKTWKRGFATQREAVAWRDSQRVRVRSGGYVAPDRGSVVSRSIPRPPVSCAGTAPGRASGGWRRAQSGRRPTSSSPGPTAPRSDPTTSAEPSRASHPPAASR